MEDNKEIEAVAIHVDVDDDKGVNESAGEPSCQEEKEEQQQQQHQQGEKGPITIIARVPEQRLCKVEEVQGLVETIRDKLGKSLAQISRKKDSPTIAIPRVPEQLRKGEEEAYEPYVVSIGPYHMGKPRLEPMQVQKWRLLHQILNRNPKVDLNDYIQAITSLEERARSCYPENIGLNKNDFVEMLLLDGCFLVEYFLPTADQLFNVAWHASHFTIDFLLLENQIPFFILQCIYELATPTTDSKDPPSFTRIALDICKEISGLKDMLLPHAAEIHHFLHLYHMYTLCSPESDSGSPSQPTVTFIRELKSKFWSMLSSFDIYRCLKKRSSSTSEPEKRVNMIPSAMELNEAGVKLKPKWIPNKSILDVKFSSTEGVIEIPRLIIDFHTNSLFRNLIAFEQLYPDSELKFTAYVKFLNFIVNTPKDATLLYSNGIIEHSWANEKEIVRLFNRLARGTTAHPTNYLHGMYEEVDRYCKARRHRWRATLICDYLGSPWSLFSLAVAFILLLLTFLQTYCSMYSYFHPSP